LIDYLILNYYKAVELSPQASELSVLTVPVDIEIKLNIFLPQGKKAVYG